MHKTLSLLIYQLIITDILSSVLISLSSMGQKNKQMLMNLLGTMPKPPALFVDTLEKTDIENGWRY
jgi:hypothetical protein